MMTLNDAFAAAPAKSGIIIFTTVFHRPKMSDASGKHEEIGDGDGGRRSS